MTTIESQGWIPMDELLDYYRDIRALRALVEENEPILKYRIDFIKKLDAEIQAVKRIFDEYNPEIL